MSAKTVTIEDMKKDVEVLINVATEAGDPISLINRVLLTVERSKDYVSSLKSSYEHELAVSEITGENRISQRFMDNILSLLTKYEKKQLIILLDATARLLISRGPKNRDSGVEEPY